MTAAEELARIAATPRLLVALDFDGTLSHLQDEPMAVRAVPGAQAALERLTGIDDTTVALVSGRTIADLRVIAEHGDDSLVWLAGSHGAQLWRPGAGEVEAEQDEADGVDEVSTEAELLVGDLDGVWIEHKAFGFALHTRLAVPEATARARADVDAMVRRRAPQWRRRTGRDVHEYAWRHEGKDSAIGVLRDAVDATAVLFAGDDVTDEDALRALGPGDLGVKVGDGDSVAGLRVAGPEELVALLRSLADARAS